jgi:hypothetical protein
VSLEQLAEDVISTAIPFEATASPSTTPAHNSISISDKNSNSICTNTISNDATSATTADAAAAIVNEEIEETYPKGWNFSIKIPQSNHLTPNKIPPEEIGHGVNQYFYYVCTNLYDASAKWIELPMSVPHEINMSCNVKKFMSGELNKMVTTTMDESSYLRSIIARISADTHVAPRDFYTAAGATALIENENSISEVNNLIGELIKNNNFSS